MASDFAFDETAEKGAWFGPFHKQKQVAEYIELLKSDPEQNTLACKVYIAWSKYIWEVTCTLWIWCMDRSSV